MTNILPSVHGSMVDCRYLCWFAGGYCTFWPTLKFLSGGSHCPCWWGRQRPESPWGWDGSAWGTFYHEWGMMETPKLWWLVLNSSKISYPTLFMRKPCRPEIAIYWFNVLVLFGFSLIFALFWCHGLLSYPLLAKTVCVDASKVDLETQLVESTSRFPWPSLT